MRPSPEITAVVVVNVVSAIAALVLTVACSRASDHSAAADLKDAGHVVAVDTRKAADEAKVAAHKLAADTRGAAHDLTHHGRSDDKSS
jgi:hypothetical protein